MTKPRQNSSIWSCVRRRPNGKCRRANGARRKPSSPSCSKTGSSWHDGQPAPHTRFLIVPFYGFILGLGLAVLVWVWCKPDRRHTQGRPRPSLAAAGSILGDDAIDLWRNGGQLP